MSNGYSGDPPRSHPPCHYRPPPGASKGDAMGDEPITVPVDEAAMEQARAKEEAERNLSILIDEVIGQLRTEVDWAYQKVNQASDHDSTDQLTALSQTLAELAAKGSESASRLTGAGIGESVYSVQACRNVANHASLAASD